MKPLLSASIALHGIAVLWSAAMLAATDFPAFAFPLAMSGVYLLLFLNERLRLGGWGK